MHPVSLFSRYYNLKCLTLKMMAKVTEYNIRNGTIRRQIHDLLFYGYSNVFIICHHLLEIRKSYKILWSLTMKINVVVK